MLLLLDKYCKGCGHRGFCGGEDCCDYLLDTRELRGCKAGNGCPHHTKLTHNTSKPITVWNGTATNTFDIITEMFHAGKTDREIAQAINRTPNYVKGWRNRNGLTNGDLARPKWNDKEAERLYKEGKSDREIADAFKTSEKAVERWRIKNGFNKLTFRPWDTELARKMFFDGKSDKEIAVAVGRSAKTVGRWRAQEKLYRAAAWGDKRDE